MKDVAFYDYDAKYIDNKITMAIPAQLDPEVVKTMRTNAEKAFRAIGGLGLARCDFFYTDKGEIFLNELNTMPGFTQWSMYPLLWDNMGDVYKRQPGKSSSRISRCFLVGPLADNLVS